MFGYKYSYYLFYLKKQKFCRKTNFEGIDLDNFHTIYFRLKYSNKIVMKTTQIIEFQTNYC